MPKREFRQSLSIPGLLKNTRHLFEQIPDNQSRCSIPLADHLMSGLAIFGLKYPSLLQFDQERNEGLTRSNLKSLYGILKAPCDTYLRERLDDALASNGPHIKCLEELNYRYLLGVKQADHQFLFDWVDHTDGTATYEQLDEKGVLHRFRYLNRAPLSDSHFELEITFLEYWEIRPNGKTTHFSWVTDILITGDNLMPLMRAGRARWKIENETFNTLKNHGYHFENNFGHGHHHLSTVMVHLMMLAFLINQIQQRCCGLFNRALDKAKTKTRFWMKIRNLFQSFLIPHWEAMYLGIANELKPTVIPYNTS